MQEFFRLVTILSIVTGFLLTTTAHAEIKTYTGIGEYLLTEETLDFAKNRAELEAERNVLDQVSVYIRGQSMMIDNELDEDEIITISAGVLHVTETKFSFESDAEEILVKAFVTANIDVDELEKLLEQAIKERGTK